MIAADLVAEYLDLRDRKAAIDNRLEQITAELRSLGVGRHQAGGHTVTVSAQRRFNTEAAARILASNPDLLLACQETTISGSKAKQVLPPALYEMCQVEAGEPRVSIR
jgi:hypothetical protein